MMNKSLKFPVIILAIGLVLAVLACMLTGMVKEPVVTQQDFNYTVTYQLDGETKTLEGVYNVRFVSTGKGIAPLERYYEGTYPTNPSESHSAV